MVYERIKDWVEEMKPATQSQPTLPKRILYYRDGVNEPQYQDVRVNELPAIRRAWNRFVQELSKKNGSEATTKSPNMDIIAIVCGKRHHVRFYPETGDRNCPPGTTVDDLVTSPCYQDFYLQSHTTTQGTARPAHYFVIANEPNMSVTQLREFVSLYILKIPLRIHPLNHIADQPAMLYLRSSPGQRLLCLTSLLCRQAM